jgi:hypothetical protein
MIMSWFTQPPGENSSYYQYDTVTKNFTRIRLELDRASSSGSTDDTFVGYKAERYVGFSTARYSTSKGNLGDWSVNEDGALCYKGVALPADRPDAGARTYDCTDPSSFVHRGNPVTTTPTLPEGIGAKHLALLANETFGGAHDAMTKLTGPDASDAELSKALKDAVCTVVGVDDFAQISDAQILAKLTSQVADIRLRAEIAKATSVDVALTEAARATDLISEQIGEGLLTPNQELQTAFGSLKDAIGKAQIAENAEAVRVALTEIGVAQRAVATAIETIDVGQRDTVAREFSAAQEAVVEVQLQAAEWRAAETGYDALAEAGSVGDYEQEMFEGTEEIV